MAALNPKSYELDIFESGLEYYARNQNQETAKRARVRHNAIRPPSAHKQEIDGEIRLQNFMNRFHGGFRFGTKPLRMGEFQLEFMHLISEIVAPNIVGNKWNIIGPRLCKKYGWKLERGAKLGLGQAARRFGKTVAMSTLMVNYALEVVGAIESAFTTSKRTSQNLKKKVLQLIVESGFGAYILRYGEEIVMIRHPERPWERPAIMSFYPSNHRIGSYRCSFFSRIIRGFIVFYFLYNFVCSHKRLHTLIFTVSNFLCRTAGITTTLDIPISWKMMTEHSSSTTFRFSRSLSCQQ